MARADAAEPAYRALAATLRSAIAAGRYRGGVRLPTEAELAAEYGLSRQTVRRAFVDLVAEGVVHRVPGRGTFATERGGRYLRQLGSIDDLMNLSTDTTMEVVEPEVKALLLFVLPLDPRCRIAEKLIDDLVSVVHVSLENVETLFQLELVALERADLCGEQAVPRDIGIGAAIRLLQKVRFGPLRSHGASHRWLLRQRQLTTSASRSWVGARSLPTEK